MLKMKFDVLTHAENLVTSNNAVANSQLYINKSFWRPKCHCALGRYVNVHLCQTKRHFKCYDRWVFNTSVTYYSMRLVWVWGGVGNRDKLTCWRLEKDTHNIDSRWKHSSPKAVHCIHRSDYPPVKKGSINTVFLLINAPVRDAKHNEGASILTLKPQNTVTKKHHFFLKICWLPHFFTVF